MCKYHGGTYEGNVPVTLAHPKSNGQTEAYVDACMQSLIQALNDVGLQTLNCCCGHGQRPGWIALEDGREIHIAANHIESRIIGDLFPPLKKPAD